MSDTSNDAGATAANQQPVAPIQFIGQFIKDLSFEVPHAPEIFQELRQTAPDIPISIDCTTRELKDKQHEVILNLHLEATVGDKAAFILEVSYACVVILGELPENHVRPVLLIEVPRQMYPFVRQIVADTTVQGGFPPLMLQLIDFMDLYRRKYATPEEHEQEAQIKADAMAKMTGGPVAGQNL
jgi:preprotein translocase subunit SecB